jgi:intein/homing endonuclease/predicted transglutaminase-like cysteine proteinase
MFDRLKEFVCSSFSCCSHFELIEREFAGLSKDVEKLRDRLADKSDRLTSTTALMEEYRQEAELLKVQIPRTNAVDEYCEGRYGRIQNRVYHNKREYAGYEYPASVNEFITPNAYSVLELKKDFPDHYYDWNLYEQVNYVTRLVSQKVRYTSDMNLKNSADYYAYPNETLAARKGDCIAEYEEVITSIGLKQAKDVKEGDFLLSFDFVKNEWVYKPVVKKWDKGVLPVYRIKFRNGTHLDLTSDHKMLVNKRFNRSDKGFEEVLVSELSNLPSWKRRVPHAVKIPFEAIDEEDLTTEHCFVIGHFLAEGWVGGKVGTSGYDVIEHIIPLLDRLQIPYSVGKNGNGVPMVNFLKSEFKDLLKSLKRNSFDIALPEWILALPDEKISAILDGYFLGDGHTHIRSSIGIKEKIYSISSETFVRQMQFMSLRLGKPLYAYKQEVHQGSGTSPIYRLNDYENSAFRTIRHWNALSEVGVSSVEYLCDVQTYDWEVQDTHNFTFWNGVVAHNCEDHAFIINSLLPFDVGVAYGFHGKTGHAFNVFVWRGELWIADGGLSSNRDHLYRYASDGHPYKIHYIITPEYTYMLKMGVEFGKLAGWLPEVE